MLPSVYCMTTCIAAEAQCYCIELCFVQVEKDAKLKKMHLVRHHAIPHQIILNHDVLAIKVRRKKYRYSAV